MKLVDATLRSKVFFEARVQGRSVVTINRYAETSNRDDTLWHPPKGAPREPSTSCCQSCRAAAMARASRSQRLRRRHPSHAADILPATLQYRIYSSPHDGIRIHRDKQRDVLTNFIYVPTTRFLLLLRYWIRGLTTGH